MKILILFVACVAAVAALPGTIRPRTILEIYTSRKAGDRIIGGSPAYVGQFPWQVGVIASGAGGAWICGGSLISDLWVLTAAHCVQGASSFTLHLGGITLNNAEEGKTVASATVSMAHPNFNDYLHNDIGLIRLNSPVTFSDRIQPVQLPSAEDRVQAGTRVTVSGWGLTSDSATGASSILNWVEVTAITNEDCTRIYGSDFIIDSTLCTIGNPNHGVCSGDSGGPLVSFNANGQAVQQGVVSFGASNGCELGFPSGFVRTASQIGWIAQNTGLNL